MKVIIGFAIFLFCFAEIVQGSCLSYGHSCWGAHGKRSYRPKINQKNLITTDKWALIKLLPDRVFIGKKSPLIDFNGDNEKGTNLKLLKNFETISPTATGKIVRSMDEDGNTYGELEPTEIDMPAVKEGNSMRFSSIYDRQNDNPNFPASQLDSKDFWFYKMITKPDSKEFRF